jgi:hypothetical protein
MAYFKKPGALYPRTPSEAGTASTAVSSFAASSAAGVGVAVTAGVSVGSTAGVSVATAVSVCSVLRTTGAVSSVFVASIDMVRWKVRCGYEIRRLWGVVSKSLKGDRREGVKECQSVSDKASCVSGGSSTWTGVTAVDKKFVEQQYWTSGSRKERQKRTRYDQVEEEAWSAVRW